MKKIKERVMKHIKTHHKKYILAGGVACGRCAMKIFLIAIMFLGVSAISQRSQASEIKIDIYQTIDLFNQIDDIAHKDMDQIENKKDISQENKQKIEKLFHEIDSKFHAAENINEKFQATKNMDNFIKEQEMVLYGSGNEKTEERKIYNRILEVFEQIE